MLNPHYPLGTVQRLLQSEHVTPVTRERMMERLQPMDAPRFFASAEYAILEAIAARLVLQPERAAPIPLAPHVDARLFENRANGWRYATMPPDGEAYKLGLAGVDDLARTRFGVAFCECAPEAQDAVLEAVQAGEVTGGSWERVSAARFFEEMLSEIVEAYYGHPDAQDEIGYVGFADVPGWKHIGLNERDEREPLPTNPERE